MLKVCEPESANEEGLFKIYDEPESPNRGLTCLTPLICTELRVNGSLSKGWRAECLSAVRERKQAVYRNRQMRGVFNYI